MLLDFPLNPAVIAYIDPGTGSIILQAVVGAIAGIAIAAKFYWHRVQKIFGFRKKSDIDELDED